MPVRSSSSSVLKWPDASVVHAAASSWARGVFRRRLDVIRIGYIGSYARGDWGMGSDLDMVVVVEDSETPFEKRGSEWDRTALPVPSDLFVYTRAEWEGLSPESRFARALREETVWIDRPVE